MEPAIQKFLLIYTNLKPVVGDSITSGGHHTGHKLVFVEPGVEKLLSRRAILRHAVDDSATLGRHHGGHRVVF